MGCKAQTAVIAEAITRICNAAERPNRRCMRRGDVFSARTVDACGAVTCSEAPLLHRRSKVQEPCAGTLKRQAHGTNGAVALLADDDLGGALVGGIRVVDFVAVDKED